MQHAKRNIDQNIRKSVIDKWSELYYDEKLFKEPPPREECPLCLLPLPIDIGQSAFHSCCGKTVCNGCIYEMAMSGGKDLDMSIL